METKSTHQVKVVRLGEPRVHSNADTLELFDIGGYQVVTKKGNFHAGDLAIYIQPDSVVPQMPAFDFLYADYLNAPDKCQHKAPEGQSIVVTDSGNESCLRCMATVVNGQTVVPEKYRRITVRRFRKEWSEGLLMPVTDFFPPVDTVKGTYYVQEGDDVAELLGITHWVPEFDRENMAAETEAAPRRRYPRTLRGWFFWGLHKLGLRSAGREVALDTGFTLPVFDVDAWKNNKRKMPEGTPVHVTEKIHGSNARYVFIDGVFYAGSHYQWKRRGNNLWWKVVEQHPEIEEWCTQNPGKVLYGEVGPSQKGFQYGCENGETFFYSFSVYDPTTNRWLWPANEGFSLTVPGMGILPMSPQVLAMADGPSLVPGAKNIREGIVLRTHDGLTLKVVGNAFLEKDSK
jgi:hypothetical protein